MMLKKIARILSFLFLFFFFVHAIFAQSKQEAPDSDENGPGVFFYQEYYQEPWRLPQSPVELLEKTAGVGLACGAAAFYIRKKREKR